MKKFLKFAGVLMALCLVLTVAVACGSETANQGSSQNNTASNSNNSSNSSSSSNSNAAPVEQKEKLSGSVVIDGSGTVYPFMALMADNYMYEEQEGVSVEVSRAGTSAGFKRFLQPNSTDFSNASRKIKEEEQALADELGIEVMELKVALDGLTIVINPENDWATELTREEIISIFLASEGKKLWSDVRPEFPSEPIKTYGPNENHGTYEFFWEVILKKEDLVEGVNLQQEYPTLVHLVSEDKYGIGFFGYGYYAYNTDKLQAVKVDFGNGPVAPSLDTIAEDGAYAGFTRPVFTYLNVNHAKEKPQVIDFALYTVKNAAQVAAETGFAPLSEADINNYITQLEALK